MEKAKKAQVVEDLKRKLAEANAILLADYRGTKVGDIHRLRRDLRKNKAELKVIKNTLFRIAAKGTSWEGVNDQFVGPTAVAFIYGDVVEPAKSFKKFAGEIAAFKIKSGMLEGSLLSLADVVKLADLLPKDQQVAMLLGVMNAPIRNLAGVFAGVLRGLVGALDQIAKKNETAEVVEAAAPSA